MKRIKTSLLLFSFLLITLLFTGCSQTDQNHSKPSSNTSNLLDLKLPKIGAPKTIATIYINNDSIVWNEEKIDFEILKSRFAKLKNENKDNTVILSSTKSTKIKRIVKVLDLAQQNDVDLILESNKNE